MRVINILGSPRRKGTSARIAKSFTDAAEGFGAQVDSFYLNGMHYRGCQGCEQCHRKSDHCILKDDLTAVLDEMRTADIALFSSPVYLGDVSGQFKQFFDRTWSHVAVDFEKENPYTSRLPHGKTAVFIICQGDVDKEKHIDIVERYTEVFHWLGYDLRVIRTTGLMDPSPDADVSSSQKKAIELAHELLNNG